MKNPTVSLSVSGVLAITAIVAWMLMAAPRVSAIPAFSRKYQNTPAPTCHSDYPELNDFGEASKKNGFKFPKDDETFVKEPPVSAWGQGSKGSLPQGALSRRNSWQRARGVPLFRQFHVQQQAAGRARLFAFCTDPGFAPDTFTIIGAGKLGHALRLG